MGMRASSLSPSLSLPFPVLQPAALGESIARTHCALIAHTLSLSLCCRSIQRDCILECLCVIPLSHSFQWFRVHLPHSPLLSSQRRSSNSPSLSAQLLCASTLFLRSSSAQRPSSRTLLVRRLAAPLRRSPLVPSSPLRGPLSSSLSRQPTGDSRTVHALAHRTRTRQTCQAQARLPPLARPQVARPLPPRQAQAPPPPRQAAAPRPRLPRLAAETIIPTREPTRQHWQHLRPGRAQRPRAAATVP